MRSKIRSLWQRAHQWHTGWGILLDKISPLQRGSFKLSCQCQLDEPRVWMGRRSALTLELQDRPQVQWGTENLVCLYNLGSVLWSLGLHHFLHIYSQARQCYRYCQCNRTYSPCHKRSSGMRNGLEIRRLSMRLVYILTCIACIFLQLLHQEIETRSPCMNRSGRDPCILCRQCMRCLGLWG